MGLILHRNDALDTNPPAGDSQLTDGGSDWLWAAFALFAFSFLVYFALSFKPRNNERIFHYLFTIALLVATISYFAMASDLAFSVIPTSNNRGDAASYQIFFAKYIHWVVSWPVIIIALGLLSGVSWATIVFNIFLAWIWAISYLCSAYTATNYKWGFYVFGTVAYFILAYQTLHVGRTASGRYSSYHGRDHEATTATTNYSRDYLMLAGYANLFWLLYPIAFGVSDGGNVISVTRSLIYFGILDVLLVIGMAFGTLVLSRKWDYGMLNMHFTQYGRVNHEGGVFPEKRPVAGTTSAPVPPPGTTTATPAV